MNSLNVWPKYDLKKTENVLMAAHIHSCDPVGWAYTVHESVDKSVHVCTVSKSVQPLKTIKLINQA